MHLHQFAALEYAKYRITVNAYAPGAIDTTFCERCQISHALGDNLKNTVGRFDEFYTEQSGNERGSWTEGVSLSSQSDSGLL